MKVLFDTSLLVAGFIEPHPMHSRALPWLRRAHARRLDLYIAAHSLAELYAVLTTLPVRPLISAATACSLIRENTEAVATVVTLSNADYDRTLDRMARLGVVGGSIYDALIARAAEKIGVERLVTLNLSDFERVWPEGKAVLISA